MVYMKINGVTTQAPLKDSYQVIVSDLDSSNSTRSETGVMNRDRIRAGVYKIAIKWQLRETELKTLLSLIEGDSFSVMFLFCGDYLTKTMYASDKTALLKATNHSTSIWELSVNFIEF